MSLFVVVAVAVDRVHSAFNRNDEVELATTQDELTAIGVQLEGACVLAAVNHDAVGGMVIGDEPASVPIAGDGAVSPGKGVVIGKCQVVRGVAADGDAAAGNEPLFLSCQVMELSKNAAGVNIAGTGVCNVSVFHLLELLFLCFADQTLFFSLAGELFFTLPLLLLFSLAVSFFLFESDKAIESWRTGTADGESGSRFLLAWNGHLNRVEPHVAPTVPDAVRLIRALASDHRPSDFLIGISYSHYESDVPREDIDAIHRIATALAKEFGEDRILFDRFGRASELFHVNGRSRSLAAYGRCRFFINLWSFWTERNVNCRAEHEVIRRVCRETGATCLYLCPQRDHTDPPVPDGEFSCSLFTSPEEIVAVARRELERLGE